MKRKRQWGGGILGWLLLVAPAKAYPSLSPLVVAYPHQVAVIDPAEADDVGILPMKGTPDAAYFLPERSLLFLHSPDTEALDIVDTRRYSPSRFQVLASYHSIELARPGLRFVQFGSLVYLAARTTAIAIVDPVSLLAKLGEQSCDFLPMIFSNHAVLPVGIFSLQDGQLAYEDSMPHLGVSAPMFIPLSGHPHTLLADGLRNKLYLSVAEPDGTGAIDVVDAASRSLSQVIPVPWPLKSLVWRDDHELAILSATHRRLGIYDLASQRWERIWSPKIPGKPLRLLEVGCPPPSEIP